MSDIISGNCYNVGDTNGSRAIDSPLSTEGCNMPAKGSKLGSAYLTHPGRERELNEDSLYANDELGLFMVADGMGGHNAGEVASAIAVTLVPTLIEEELATSQDLVELVREAISTSNQVVLEKSLNNSAWSEMGTTFVLALFTDDKVVTAHVGDSRAYWIRKGEIMQLTQDHTFVAEWLREGLITKEEARTHGQRHGLIEALGVADEVESEVAVWPREQEGCILLCSDGLTDMLEDEEILAIVESSSDPDTACSELVDAANSKGGLDNITVILVCPEQRAAGSDLE